MTLTEVSMCEARGSDDRSAARSDLSGGPARRGTERTEQMKMTLTVLVFLRKFIAKG